MGSIPLIMNNGMLMPVAKQSTPGEIIIKFMSKKCRYESPSDVGVMCACDAGHFVGFQLMYATLILAHEIQVAFIDLGLRENQLEWCRKQPNIILMEKNFHCPFSTDKKAWQTWNKPFYMLNSPFKKTIWLDTDVVIAQYITDMFVILDKQPLLCPDPNPSCKDTLFQHMPLNGIMKELSPYVNAGVIGLDKERDSELHEYWMYAVERAAENPEIEKAMMYYDQGALKWAIYKCKAIKHVLPTYNYDKILGRKPMGLYDLLSVVKRQPEHVLHFAGNLKPWSEWGYFMDLNFNYNELKDKTSNNQNSIKEFEDKMKLYILHSQPHMLDKTSNKKFVEKINLNTLDVEEFQIADLAESKFFVSRKWQNHDKEFMGMVTARWDKKFPQLPPLDKIYTIKDQIKPNTVLCPSTTTSWGEDNEYLEIIANRYNLQINKNKVPVDTNLFCAKQVFNDIMEFWFKAFFDIYEELDVPNKELAILSRKIISLYLANRDDLIIEEINHALLPSVA